MPTDKRQRQREGRVARREAALAAQRRASRRRSIILFTGIVVVTFIVLLVLGVLGDDDGGTELEAANDCPELEGQERRTTFERPPSMCIALDNRYQAVLVTDVGEITIDLDAKNKTNTVNNFVVLARYHYYDGTKFHRVIKDFVVQGGDPAGTGGSEFPGYTIPDERLTGTIYKEGSVAMANRGPNTAGSQFFIVVSENGANQLEPNYTLFGTVTQGMDVVKKIEADGGTNENMGKPAVDHTVERVRINEF